MIKTKPNLSDIVVITGVGKHEQACYYNLPRSELRQFIGDLGEVVGTGGLPYHWIRISDEHNKFLHLDRSEFEIIDNLDNKGD